MDFKKIVEELELLLSGLHHRSDPLVVIGMALRVLLHQQEILMGTLTDLKTKTEGYTAAIASLGSAVDSLIAKPGGLDAADQATLDTALANLDQATAEVANIQGKITAALAPPATTPPAA